MALVAKAEAARTRLRPRAGSALTLVVGLVLVAGVVLAAVYFLNRSAGMDPSEMPLVDMARRGPFDHIVLEHGEVESSSNTEVICEVKSKGTNGTPIIWVIPEGSRVKKGELLVRLDSSGLEEEFQRQKIAVNSSRALMISADSLLRQAEISKTEYIDGTFKQEEKTIQNEILVAEENLSRAQESAKFSQRLASLGFQTAQALKADLFAVEKAKNELELARNKLKTLQEITREKMLIGFDSDIEAAKAKLDAETDSFNEEDKLLKELEQQIKNCEIRAPNDGQVVYANIVSRRGGSEFVVEAGALVRERQVIIRLPDPGQMQVKATINESRITLVEEGMPVDVRIGAFDAERPLKGRVKKVNKYAEPGSWFSSQVKEYACFIDINNPPAEIRTGMTAEIRILVDHLDDALQVPVQAICEHKGRTFCLIQKDNTWETREVVMAATNDKTVVIGSGLDENETVVLNPRRYEELLDLPDLPDPEKPQDLGPPADQQEVIGQQSPDDRREPGQGEPRDGGEPSIGDSSQTAVAALEPGSNEPASGEQASGEQAESREAGYGSGATSLSPRAGGGE